jgi:uncharacterized protein (TIRG00374 family)
MVDSTPFLTRTWDFLKKPLVSLAFRVGLSVLLLVFLFRLAVVEKIVDVFSRISLGYLGLYFVLYFLAVGLMAIRWRYLLKAWDIERTFSVLFRWIMVGLFLNNFLPGGLGGDAFRLYSGSQDTSRTEDIAATIFYERFLSYTSLVLLGLVALILRANFSGDRLFWFLLGGIFLALIALFALLAFAGFRDMLARFIDQSPGIQKLGLKKWLDSFRFRVHHPFMLPGVFAISFLIQFVQVFIFHLIALALRLPVQMSDLFLFVPLLYLATIIPVSVNGIGIRETVFVFFASRWGISQADAVGFSLTVFTLGLVGSLVGGPLYWVSRK